LKKHSVPQKALRDKAGLPTELFPVGAFVGMISDEIESLLSAATPIRRLRTPIRAHSKTEISAAEIAQHYAGPEQRHPEQYHPRPE
jgi:hypothetical protein